MVKYHQVTSSIIKLLKHPYHFHNIALKSDEHYAKRTINVNAKYISG